VELDLTKGRLVERFRAKGRCVTHSITKYELVVNLKTAKALGLTCQTRCSDAGFSGQDRCSAAASRPGWPRSHLSFQAAREIQQGRLPPEERPTVRSRPQSPQIRSV